jgi:hypothetical protein
LEFPNAGIITLFNGMSKVLDENVIESKVVFCYTTIVRNPSLRKGVAL